MATGNQFDLLVIGGGIHGVGVAQAAAAGGHSVLLLEQADLAAGTSSRSSKLIHGGLRYLETWQISLVRESLREREWLLRAAPDLVRRQAFFLPVYRQTSRRGWYLRAGLSLYTVLAGLGQHTRFRSVPRREWTRLDGLCTTDLQSVLQYWDAQTDDAALTRAVMRSAESCGAQCCCGAEFLSAEIGPNECVSHFRVGQQTRQVQSRAIVNAAGPWAGTVAERIRPRAPVAEVELVQGSHLELPGRIQRGCYYLEAPQDSRAVFVMPWHDRTLLGTTELIYRGAPEKTQPTTQEVEYLIRVFGHYFPGRPRDVLEQWAGLRVLPAGGTASRRSRETQLIVDDAKRPRVLSIFGGKLTTYRATAAKVLHQLAAALPTRKPIADTRDLKLHAG
jgi:glycerol-3-phosphate dehydrogenase